MELLKSVILSEMSTLLMEVDKRHTLAKFGFDEKLQNAFHEIDNKVSPWFATIITNQFAKDNNIQGNNLAEILGRVNQDDLLMYLRQKKHLLNFIRDWIKHPNRPQNINLQSFRDLDAAFKAADEWHKELQKKQGGGFVDKRAPDGEIIKTYPDYYWIDLKKNYCPDEARHMSHCANDSRATTLISLRNVHNHESYVTIGYNANTKMITQVKGRGNDRPIEKYHVYVRDLIKDWYEKGKLVGFDWSYGDDVTPQDIEKTFQDKYDYMGILLNSPAFKSYANFTTDQIQDYLTHYIDYDNIDYENYKSIKDKVKQLIPYDSKYREEFLRINNNLVDVKLIGKDKDNFLVALMLKELPRQFFIRDLLKNANISPEEFKQMIQTAPTDVIIGLMNTMATGYIFPIVNGRKMTDREVYTALRRMVSFEDRAEARERIMDMLGDRLNVLKGTRFANMIKTEFPELVKDYPVLAQAVNGDVNEVIANEIDEAGSLFQDFLRRSSLGNKKNNTNNFSSSPRKTTSSDYQAPNDKIPDEFEKYSRYGNKVTGVNLDNKRKNLIHQLDAKQPEVYKMLKNGLQGFDVKPRERNMYLENRTYDYSATYKNYPLIVEHLISIVPHDGFFNVRYDNKVSVDTSTQSEDTVTKLIKYKHPSVQIKKEGKYLIYKLPFQSTSLSDQAQFTDVNKLPEIMQAYIQKVKLFNAEILSAFKKAY